MSTTTIKISNSDYISLESMLRLLMEQGYTEEAIALAAELNQSTISRILSGEIRSPKLYTAIKIYDVFQKYYQHRESAFF